MDHKLQNYLEQLFLINLNIDWINSKCENIYDEISNLEEGEEIDNPEKIKKLYSDLEYLIIQLSSERKHLDILQKEFKDL